MPKKIEEKNIKGSKKTTKTSNTKKLQKPKKLKKENTKPIKTKNEVKEVSVVKNENMKGRKENSLINNTPFVVCVCIIILLSAVLIFVLSTKRVPLTSKGKEIIATLKGKTITADDLYLNLKENDGKNQLLNIIDEYISEKEVTITEEDEKYVKEVVDYYIDYAEYYETDLETFLINYVGINGISSEKEFKEFVEKDYKKTLAIQKYIGDTTKEEQLKEFYKENYTDKLTVKHILIEVDSEAEDADQADDQAYDKAVKLIQKLNNTAKDDLDKKFEELAEKNSDDTGTYSNGGLVENFTKSEVEEEFYDASNKLKNGEYTKKPIKTSYGYHIILKVNSTPVEDFKDIVDDVKKSYAEDQLSKDANLYSLKWDELRKEYKLSIKDDLIKEAYKNSINDIKNKKSETN